MNLDKAQELALDLMQEHRLIEKGWTFHFDNAKTRFGLCWYGKKRIQLSKILVNAELNEGVVENTILHEIAHALDCLKRGRSSHDYKWRRLARSIGCDGNRCGDYLTSSPKLLPKPKWKITCPVCKTEFFRHLNRSNKQQSCGKCSSRWDERFILIWSLNK